MTKAQVGNRPGGKACRETRTQEPKLRGFKAQEGPKSRGDQSPLEPMPTEIKAYLVSKACRRTKSQEGPKTRKDQILRGPKPRVDQILRGPKPRVDQSLGHQSLGWTKTGDQCLDGPKPRKAKAEGTIFPL